MSVQKSSIHIKADEYNQRIEKLTDYLHDQKLSGVVLFDRDYILYYAGFAFIPTERPIGFVINAKGERALFVPRLEMEHAAGNALVDRVDYYLEYPFKPRPEEILKNLLDEMGVSGDYGSDHDGYPWILGYRGPSLTKLMGTSPKSVAGFVEDEMMIKSPAEIQLIRESAKWGNLAHMLLQRYTKIGATETEVSLQASQEATLAMLDAIGPIYRAQSFISNGAFAGYRGQIGRNAAIPHALSNNIVFQSGDVLVTGANAPVWGYNSELERTMVIGKPSDPVKRYFDHMVALQDIAFEAIEPGVPCAEVDRVVRAYYEEHDLMPNWKHHVGHAIGLRYHEAPFLDLGDETVIQTGMVFTIEPGLYLPELGGFRHSDTVVVTEDGVELLTYYPRDLESLTL